jgi:hypothetical protein
MQKQLRWCCCSTHCVLLLLLLLLLQGVHSRNLATAAAHLLPRI